LTALVNIALVLILSQDTTAPPSWADTAEAEFGAMNYDRSITIYDSLLTSSSDSALILWKLARSWVCAGDIAPHSERIRYYTEAEGFAAGSVNADSLSSEGHTWLAASIGNIAMYEGGKTKIQLCRTVKKEIDRALELNPKNALAYSILGSFYKALGDVSWLERRLAGLFLGGLPDGGYEESEAAFRKAIGLAPEVIRNHFELAKVYMLQDRDEEAFVEFQRALWLPNHIGMDCEMQQSAVELLEELREKHPREFRKAE